MLRHIKGTLYQRSLPLLMLTFVDHLADVVSVRFSTIKLFFTPLSYCMLWKEVLCAAPQKASGIIP